jgi:hypothetical protein
VTSFSQLSVLHKVTHKAGSLITACFGVGWEGSGHDISTDVTGHCKEE